MKGRNEIWKYKYKDKLVKVIENDPIIGETPTLTVENRHLFKNCPIEINTQTDEAFIYSDEEIPRLELVDNDVVPAPNIVREIDLASIPLKEELQ